MLKLQMLTVAADDARLGLLLAQAEQSAEGTIHEAFTDVLVRRV